MSSKPSETEKDPPRHPKGSHHCCKYCQLNEIHGHEDHICLPNCSEFTLNSDFGNYFCPATAPCNCNPFSCVSTFSKEFDVNDLCENTFNIIKNRISNNANNMNGNIQMIQNNQIVKQIVSQHLSNIEFNSNRSQSDQLRSGILLMEITYLYIYELRLSLIDMKDCDLFVALCDLRKDNDSCFLAATGTLFTLRNYQVALFESGLFNIMHSKFIESKSKIVTIAWILYIYIHLYKEVKQVHSDHAQFLDEYYNYILNLTDGEIIKQADDFKTHLQSILGYSKTFAPDYFHKMSDMILKRMLQSSALQMRVIGCDILIKFFDKAQATRSDVLPILFDELQSKGFLEDLFKDEYLHPTVLQKYQKLLPELYGNEYQFDRFQLFSYLWEIYIHYEDYSDRADDMILTLMTSNIDDDTLFDSVRQFLIIPFQYNDGITNKDISLVAKFIVKLTKIYDPKKQTNRLINLVDNVFIACINPIVNENSEDVSKKLYDILKSIFELEPEKMEIYYKNCYEKISSWESLQIDEIKSVTCCIRLLPIFYEKVKAEDDLFKILIKELSNIVNKTELESIVKEKDIEIRMLSISSYITKKNNPLDVETYKALKASLQNSKYEKYLILFFRTLLNGNRDFNNNKSEEKKQEESNQSNSPSNGSNNNNNGNNNNNNVKMMSDDAFKMILDDLLSISEDKRDAEIVSCTTDYFLVEEKYNYPPHNYLDYYWPIMMLESNKEFHEFSKEYDRLENKTNPEQMLCKIDNVLTSYLDQTTATEITDFHLSQCIRLLQNVYEKNDNCIKLIRTFDLSNYAVVVVNYKGQDYYFPHYGITPLSVILDELKNVIVLPPNYALTCSKKPFPLNIHLPVCSVEKDELSYKLSLEQFDVEPDYRLIQHIENTQQLMFKVLSRRIDDEDPQFINKIWFGVEDFMLPSSFCEEIRNWCSINWENIFRQDFFTATYYLSNIDQFFSDNVYKNEEIKETFQRNNGLYCLIQFVYRNKEMLKQINKRIVCAANSSISRILTKYKDECINKGYSAELIKIYSEIMGCILDVNEKRRQCDEIVNIVYPLLEADPSLLPLFDGCIDKYAEDYENCKSSFMRFNYRMINCPVGKKFIELYYSKRPVERIVNDFYDKIVASVPEKNLSGDTVTRLKKWIDNIKEQTSECPELNHSINDMINIIEENLDNELYISNILDILSYALENCVILFSVESRLLNIIINKILFTTPMSALKENAISSCYRVLLCIFKNNPHDVSMDILHPFLKLHWDGRPGDVNIKDVNVRYSKEHSGLRNLGSTCYVNSLIQQLYHIEPIREEILSISTSSIEKTDENKEKILLLEELQKIFLHLDYSSTHFQDTEQFVNSCKILRLDFDVRSQNDVRSFYDNLIDILSELCKLYNCHSFIDEYLKGEIVTITKREKCEHIGINRQPMYCIDVPIEKFSSLEEALADSVEFKSVGTEIVCGECNTKSELFKCERYTSLPPFLFMNLKRMKLDYDTFTVVKDNNKLSFPKEVDIYPYTYEYYQNNEEEKKEDDSNKRPKKEILYELTGVVIHKGQANAGHYYSFIKIDDKWYNFNDKSVSSIEWSSIEHDGFPAQGNNSAYLLLYKRKDIMTEYNKNNEICNELKPVCDDIKMNNDKFNQEKRIINSSLSELLLDIYSEIFTNFNDYSEMLGKTGVNRNEIIQFSVNFLFKIVILNEWNDTIEKWCNFIIEACKLFPEHRLQVLQLLNDKFEDYIYPLYIQGNVDIKVLESGINNLLSYLLSINVNEDEMLKNAILTCCSQDDNIKRCELLASIIPKPEIIVTPEEIRTNHIVAKFLLNIMNLCILVQQRYHKVKNLLSTICALSKVPSCKAIIRLLDITTDLVQFVLPDSPFFENVTEKKYKSWDELAKLWGSEMDYSYLDNGISALLNSVTPSPGCVVEDGFIYPPIAPTCLSYLADPVFYKYCLSKSLSEETLSDLYKVLISEIHIMDFDFIFSISRKISTAMKGLAFINLLAKKNVLTGVEIDTICYYDKKCLFNLLKSKVDKSKKKLMEDNCKCHKKVSGLIRFFYDLHITHKVPAPVRTTASDFYNILNWVYSTASYESAYEGNLCKRKRGKCEEFVLPLLQLFADSTGKKIDTIPEQLHPNRDLLNNTIIGPTSFTGSCNVSDSYLFTKWMLIDIPNSEDGYIKGIHFYTKDTIVNEIPEVMLGIYDYETNGEKPEDFDGKKCEIKVEDNVSCRFDSGTITEIIGEDVYNIEYEEKEEIKNYIVTRHSFTKCWTDSGFKLKYIVDLPKATYKNRYGFISFPNPIPIKANQYVGFQLKNSDSNSNIFDIGFATQETSNGSVFLKQEEIYKFKYNMTSNAYHRRYTPAVSVVINNRENEIVEAWGEDKTPVPPLAIKNGDNNIPQLINLELTKEDEDNIRMLVEVTNQPYERCKTVYQNCNRNMDQAFNIVYDQ